MRAWLGETSLVEFAGTYLHRHPVARSAATHLPSFGWDALGRILAGDPAPDALVVARGELVHVPAPRSLGALRRLMTRGVGLVIRRCERGARADRRHRRWPRLRLALRRGARLRRADGRDPGLLLRANTVSPASEEAPDFTRFHSERSPLATARLEAGDWLYIPSRWWHTARCVADSLSISIRVRL